MEALDLEHGADSGCGTIQARVRQPSTVAEPAVGRTSPSTMRIVVLLPAPFGPRKPVTHPRPDFEREIVDGGDCAESLREPADRDRGREPIGAPEAARPSRCWW